MNTYTMHLNRKALFAAMISAAFPTTVLAAAGKVQFASGGAAVQSADGSTKILAKGTEINQGDTILTGAGRAQVKFSDGGYISFQPNTQFKVEEYNFNGKQDGTEKGFFRLIEGGLRVITGLVGRENRPAYRMATPVATIGIRGSYFLAEFREKLNTHVGQGSIFVFNEQGNIILFQGQGASVGAGTAPVYSDEEMTLGAKGPEGGTPDDNFNQQFASNINNIFKIAEQYDENGIPIVLNQSESLGGISSVIANLNGINAQGSYQLDPNVVQTGGNNVYDTEILYGNLFANFGSYSISGYVAINSNAVGPSGSLSACNFFCLEGSILNSGSFGLSGQGVDGVCLGSCTLNMIGAFSGAQAEKAAVSYTIVANPGEFSPGIPNVVIGDTVTGTAGFIADPPPSGIGISPGGGIGEGG